MQVLDEWAWTLYETKDNVVTVSEEGCGHFQTIKRCIDDENDSKHGCQQVPALSVDEGNAKGVDWQAEVIEASRTVSDLLTHRKHSGTFLKSYYLLDYACTDGRAEVTKHKVPFLSLRPWLAGSVVAVLEGVPAVGDDRAADADGGVLSGGEVQGDAAGVGG